MERRYYLLKIAVVVIAILTVGITSGMGTTEMAHAINHARYSAPSRIQAAAWHTTAYVVRGVAGLFGAENCAKL